ncbi:MAG: 3-hydroxyacyl-CoA dehydrogenase family protein [Hafnia sp.]
MSEYTKEHYARSPMGVIGAGTLGRRIALMLASRGAEVRLFDTNEKALLDGFSYVKENLPVQVKKTDDGRMGKIVPVKTISEAVDGTWLVVEAVPENVNLKRTILEELDSLSSSNTIIASNSSSFPSSELINNVTNPNRVLSAHFYMPPNLIPVEIMSSGKTEPFYIQRLLDVFPLLGLKPFHVRVDSVGLIFNRIWAAIKRESLYVVAQGVSKPVEVDEIFEMVIGANKGPFRLMDQVGLDVVLDIEEHYAHLRQGLPIEVRALLKEYIDKGWLGVKTGRGFYNDYK